MQQELVLKRLATIEGHIRGVEKMVEQGAYCVDVIRQIHAIQSALSKVSAMVLEDHLNSCVITAIRGEDPKEREKVLDEISELFITASKY
jgi:DNA-binding FrmR family transcriptional regulator